MAYTKTEWKDRVVEKPQTYTMVTNPDGTVTLVPVPGTVLQEGTPVNATNMGKIEQGIADAATKADLDAKFDVPTGHNHDGTQGNGPPVRYLESADGLKVEAFSTQSLGLTKTPPACDGDILAVIADSDYVYVATATKKVHKYRNSDLSLVASTVVLSSSSATTQMCQDANYLYVTMYRKVSKIRKSDMAEVASANISGTNVEYAIEIDGEYLYLGISTNLHRYKTADMTSTGLVSPSYGGTITSVVCDDTYVYIVGVTVKQVWKLLKSDLTKIGESTQAYNGNPYHILQNAEYLYVLGTTTGGVGTNPVSKYSKSGLAKIGDTPVAYASHAISQDLAHLYLSTSNKPIKVLKNDMTTVIAEGPADTDTVNGIFYNGTYVFMGGNSDKLQQFKLEYSAPLLRIVST